MSSFTIDNILSPAFSSKRKLNDSIQENSNQLRSPFQPITPNFNQINPVAFFTFASLAYKSSPNSPYLNSSGYSSTSSSVSFIDASTQEEEIDIEDDSDDNIEVSLSHRNPKREKRNGYVRHAKKYSTDLHYCSVISVSTLEKNHMLVMYVEKRFLHHLLLTLMSAFIVEKSLMNVIHVVKNSPLAQISTTTS